MNDANAVPGPTGNDAPAVTVTGGDVGAALGGAAVKPLATAAEIAANDPPGRTWVWIRYDKKTGHWIARAGGNIIAFSRDKVTLVKSQAAVRKHIHAMFGELAEMVVCGKDGQIKERRTYGADPKGRG